MAAVRVLCLLMVLFPLPLFADAGNREVEIKAAYLYKFCLYVEWPEAILNSATGALKIGVVGSNDLADELQRVAMTRQIKDKPIQVFSIDGNSKLDNLHVLYLGVDGGEYIEKLANKAAQLAILTVTEQQNSQSIPRIIDFIIENNRIRFDVDLQQADKVGLHLSSELLAVARVVNKATTRLQ